MPVYKIVAVEVCDATTVDSTGAADYPNLLHQKSPGSKKDVSCIIIIILPAVPGIQILSPATGRNNPLSEKGRGTFQLLHPWSCPYRT